MSSKRRANTDDALTRRERQIMDIIYATGPATARTIEDQMSDAPTYATVRTLLRVLLEKGHLRRRQEGKAFVYEPRKAPDTAARNALQKMVDVFFSGSVERVISSLLDGRGKAPAPDELDRLEQLIREARNRTPQ